jgi:hypothetical protein
MSHVGPCHHGMARPRVVGGVILQMWRLQLKVKCKWFLCLTKNHIMKVYWVREGIAPRILNLDAKWRLVVSFTPRPLYPRE